MMQWSRLKEERSHLREETLARAERKTNIMRELTEEIAVRN